MGVRRTDADLDFVVGEYRSFEWFWTDGGEMPALDAFERLSRDDQAAMIATFEYWAGLKPGVRALESRVNDEHADPKILVAKAGKHRFTVFHGGDQVWVVHAYYRKNKGKLDKMGRETVKRTVRAHEDYHRRVEEGTYYERY